MLIPTRVREEVIAGHEEVGTSVPDPHVVPWVEVVMLTTAEAITEAQIKVDIGSAGHRDLGECAVIAVCQHRGYTALLDDAVGRDHARLRQVPVLTSELILIEACRTIRQVDAELLDRMHDDLARTGMRLPLREDGFAMWTLESGLLEWDDLHPPVT